MLQLGIDDEGKNENHTSDAHRRPSPLNKVDEACHKGGQRDQCHECSHGYGEADAVGDAVGDAVADGCSLA